MILITYNHPLHGKQELPARELDFRDGEYHVVNEYGVTYQVIHPERIININ